MVAFTSILDVDRSDQVRTLWRLLEDRCGYARPPDSIEPHFVWQVADSYDWQTLEDVIPRLARRIPAFTIDTTGIGIFTGANPHIYIPIVRTRRLDSIHQLLWEKILPCSLMASLDYAPAAWVPHISLANMGVSSTNLTCVAEQLVRQDFSWKISVDNFAVLEDPTSSSAKMRYRWLLIPEANRFTGTIG